MSKTITISDETYKALKSQIEESEKKVFKPYPIATVNDKGEQQRLILNLPDDFLAKPYKGRLVAIDRKGSLASDRPKNEPRWKFYSTGANKQVFPIID